MSCTRWTALRLVHALGAAARAAGRELTCLVQVSLDGDTAARRGRRPVTLKEMAAALAAEPGLLLGGVMAVAPLGMAPAEAFAPLRACSDTIRAGPAGSEHHLRGHER